MTLATAMIVLLTNHGYWVAGQEYSVNFAWAVKGGLPAATVDWVLLAGEVPLAHGQLPLPTDAADGAVLTIRAPDVRVPTRLTLRYSVQKAREKDSQLHQGSKTVLVFPPRDLKSLAQPLGGIEVAVWDKHGHLSDYMSAQELPFTRLTSQSDLLTTRAQIILVGPETLEDANLFPLLSDQASRGASVAIFRQSMIGRLGPYQLAQRPAAALQWRVDHPLLSGLPTDAWQSLVHEDQVVLLVPIDHPALELAFYPLETDATLSVPLDALLLTQAVGEGRIVFCQVPIGPWTLDPRSQVLLQSMLNYLLTRPAPTPPPSQRMPPTTQPSPKQLINKD